MPYVQSLYKEGLPRMKPHGSRSNSDYTDMMLPDRVWQVASAHGEHTTGFGGHTLLVEEGVPLSETYGNITPGRICHEGNRGT